MAHESGQSSHLSLAVAACMMLLTAGACPLPVSDVDGIESESTALVEVVAEEPNVLRRIRAYCQKSWRNGRISPQDWDDCTQDVLVRLFETIGTERMNQAIANSESDERRELNRAVWAIAQRWRRRTKHVELEDAVARTEVSHWPAVEEALGHIRQAIHSGAASLSPVQELVLSRWSNGDSVAAISSDLRMTPARISDEKYKAIRKLRAWFDVVVG